MAKPEDGPQDDTQPEKPQSAGALDESKLEEIADQELDGVSGGIHTAATTKLQAKLRVQSVARRAAAGDFVRRR